MKFLWLSGFLYTAYLIAADSFSEAFIFFVIYAFVLIGLELGSMNGRG